MTDQHDFARRVTEGGMRYRWLTLVAATGVGMGACDRGSAEQEKATAAVHASTVVVDTGTFLHLVDGAGIVSARIGYVAALSAPAPTRIVRIHIAIGDRVRVGAPLIDFDATPFDAALTSAQAVLTTAEQASTRATRLVSAGIAPRRDAEVARSDLAAAQAAATNARRAWQLATLRAPITGIVTRVGAVLGASVDVGQTLVELVDPSHLDVLLQLSPSAATQLRAGQSVTFTQNASQHAMTIGSGRVADVSAVVDSGTRAVSVRVTIDSRARPVRVGETVFGQVTIGRHVGVTVIPDEALVPFEEGFRVFVVDSANIAHARNVTIGGRAGNRAWVTDGVTAGERVVTAGAYGMDDGARVVTVDAAKQVKP